MDYIFWQFTSIGSQSQAASNDRLARLKRRINKEINLAAAIVLFILGFIILDGATAFLDRMLLVSVGFFVCVFCDFAAIIVSVAALFILKPKKKIKAD